MTTVACNIPGGLALGLAAAPNGQYTVSVQLNGPPSGGGVNLGQNRGYGLTDVDETFWANWLTASETPTQAPSGGIYYGNNPALQSGAVWET